MEELTDTTLIEALRLEVYRHFPSRSIKQFDEFVKRFEENVKYIETFLDKDD